MAETAVAHDSHASSTGLSNVKLGMWLFLVALGVLFVSVILGYVVVRVDNGAAFIPDGAPPPPPLLLASTALLLVSSASIQSAVRAARAGDPRQGARMVLTVVLAVCFLLLQAIAWWQLFSQNLIKNLEFSASIYNLLDQSYSDPASRIHTQDKILQDGRSFRVKLTYRF